MRRLKPLAGLRTLMLPLLLIPELCYGAGGAVALSGFIGSHIVTQALDAFGGIAAAAIFYYAVRMVVTAYQEKSYTDVINSFIYVLLGFIVIALSSAFTNSFLPTGGVGTGAVYPDFAGGGRLILGLDSVKGFIITGSAGVFTMMVVFAGLRMVTSQGDEAAFGKWAKVLVGNCIGVIVMLIADAIVLGITTPGDPGAIVDELAGIILFILTIIGFASMISLIIAGVLLIVSVDEALRDRAKRTIIGTLVALLVVIASYTLIRTFVGF